MTFDELAFAYLSRISAITQVDPADQFLSHLIEHETVEFGMECALLVVEALAFSDVRAGTRESRDYLDLPLSLKRLGVERRLKELREHDHERWAAFNGYPSYVVEKMKQEDIDLTEALKQWGDDRNDRAENPK